MTSEKFRLGIDVGGTNTDAVLMKAKTVVAAAKSTTTADVRSGVVSVVTDLLERSGTVGNTIEAVMIGTTQFINAFVQGQNLSRVGVIRIALPKGDGVPPMASWPDDLVSAIAPEIEMVTGGSLYTGEEYASLDLDAIQNFAVAAHRQGCSSFAITGAFSPIRPDIEERAAAIVRAVHPDLKVTLSHAVGGPGLIERENAAIINASLAHLSTTVIESLKSAFVNLHIAAPIYFSQNDGTLISTKMAERFPILTCSAGPTNSLRGAAFLTGLENAIVADIGGTTTDIGFLLRGFPRETTAANYIGGVKTNFRMPDVLSIGIGGGSMVRSDSGRVTVGPHSVGFRLAEEAFVFGGNTLTATDIAVRAGTAEFGSKDNVRHLPEELVQKALDAIHLSIEDAVDQVKTSATAIPLVLVGGGSILISRSLKGVSEVHRPEHAGVANAVGAAIALVSGRVDRLYSIKEHGREAALQQAKAEAMQAAVSAGARASDLQIVEVIELPMTHMKSDSVQIKVRAVGPLASLN